MSSIFVVAVEIEYALLQSKVIGTLEKANMTRDILMYVSEV